MRVMTTGAAPWVNSGYGKPWRYIFPRLHAAGHELAQACFFGWRGSVAEVDIGGAPVKMYPQAKDQFFNDIIEKHAAEFEADVVITMQDVWTLTGWGSYDFRWCPNFPIDTEPVSPAIMAAIEGCHTPLVNTRWAQEQLFERGWMNAHYLPYGVDTSIFTPGDKAAARAALGIPADAFVAGMVAANSSYPSRKSFPEVLLAFRAWLDDGNDGYLYLHTTITPKRNRGIALDQIMDMLDLPWSTIDDPEPGRREAARVLFPSQYRMWSGVVDDAELAVAYRAMDVLLEPSQAEGFGIPIIEAQACGVPVVTLNITAMPELTFAGLCLEPVQRCWEAEGGWRGVAGVGDILDAIRWADELTDAERAELAEIGRLGAENFDFDAEIDRDWLPLLERLEAEG
jgi:glycosyltransferase involved in cell wall biosynthesis